MLVYLNKLHREPGHLQDVIGRVQTIPLQERDRIGPGESYYPFISTGLEIGHTGGSLSLPLWKSIEVTHRHDVPIFTERLFVESGPEKDPVITPVCAKNQTSNDEYSVLFYKNIENVLVPYLQDPKNCTIGDPRIGALMEVGYSGVTRGIGNACEKTLHMLRKNPLVDRIGYDTNSFSGLLAEIDTLLEQTDDPNPLVQSLFPDPRDLPIRSVIENDKTLNLLSVLSRRESVVNLDFSSATPLQLWDVPDNRRTHSGDSYLGEYGNAMKATDLTARGRVFAGKLDEGSVKFEEYVNRFGIDMFKNKLSYMGYDLDQCIAIMNKFIKQANFIASYSGDPETVTLLQDGCDLVVRKTFADEIKISVELSDCDSDDLAERSVFGVYYDLATARLCSSGIGLFQSHTGRVLGT